MKKLLLQALMLSAYSLQAQTLSKFKAGVENMFHATMTKDFDALLDATYPKFFEIMTREQMRKVLVETFAGNEVAKV